MDRWYHCIELPDGTVTPGAFDLRPAARVVPLPRDLTGLRCLDVGTWDGFWAFEMERRGAEEVVAIDIEDPDRWDWPPRERLSARRGGLAVLADGKPPGANFAAAARALGSSARRVERSVYELDPEADGRFDVVFLGSLLLHLRDPVAALDRVRAVCSGQAVIADTVEAIPSLLRPRTPLARLEGVERPWWWLPNRAALHQMVRSAGFEILEATGVYYVPTGSGHERTRLRDLARGLVTPAGREEAIVALRGVPHAAVRARPLA
ncbi:MAG TPA: methyltransferase domain-containing protein [Solirubrobacteraceae bacterium]|nr:methyltransferase domain-containing protein [Solirubrobacteraceae bacterium]